MTASIRAPRCSCQGERTRQHDDCLPAYADARRATAGAVHLDGEAAGPTDEIPLLRPEPRDAVRGDKPAGLPEPHTDGGVRGPGREVLRNPVVRDEVPTVGQRA